MLQIYFSWTLEPFYQRKYFKATNFEIYTYIMNDFSNRLSLEIRMVLFVKRNSCRVLRKEFRFKRVLHDTFFLLLVRTVFPLLSDFYTWFCSFQSYVSFLVTFSGFGWVWCTHMCFVILDIFHPFLLFSCI